MSYSWGAGRAPTRLDGIAVVAPVDGRAVAGNWPGGAAGVTALTSGPLPVQQQRLAAELAPMVQVWQRLLAQHVPDRSGRCRCCTKGGTGLPSAPWPCAIYGVADMARRWHAAHEPAGA